MLEFIWKLRGAPDESTVKNIAANFKIPKGLARVLVARGLDTPKKVNDYFHPSLDNLYDPFLLKDMDKAVDRILKAIKNKEKIIVHGDYDVDGTTSTSMLVEFIRKLGGNITYHIPDRFQEG